MIPVSLFELSTMNKYFYLLLMQSLEYQELKEET